MSELKSVLAKRGVNDKYYSIGKEKENRFCIVRRGFFSFHWEVYHFERGERGVISKFDNENDACEYYLKRILSWS